MKPYLTTDAATLYHARAEEVYPHLAAGSVSMVWSDGPYAMRKAAWDMMGVDGLADWYAPHIEAWGRICAPSATVYLWNTAEGWARIDPVMRAAGWTFRVLVTWLKTNPPSQKGQEALTCWADFTEVCGVYQREEWNPIEAGRALRWAGVKPREIDAAVGVACMASRKWLGTDEQAQAPSAEDLEQVRAALPGLNWPWTAARPRPDFVAPDAFGNVWTAAMVPPTHRLKTCNGDTHECEKPLAFASRAILASTRPGDTILDPFAGTNRIAVACQRLPPDERRHAIGIEMEQRWLDAVRPSLVADHGAEVRKGQPSLFGPRRSVV